MPLDELKPAPPAPVVPAEGDGSGIYCNRCDAQDCDWFGICPHTPQLWCTLNPLSELALDRRQIFDDDTRKG